MIEKSPDTLVEFSAAILLWSEEKQQLVLEKFVESAGRCPWVYRKENGQKKKYILQFWSNKLQAVSEEKTENSKRPQKIIPLDFDFLEISQGDRELLTKLSMDLERPVVPSQRQPYYRSWIEDCDHRQRENPQRKLLQEYIDEMAEQIRSMITRLLKEGSLSSDIRFQPHIPSLHLHWESKKGTSHIIALAKMIQRFTELAESTKNISAKFSVKNEKTSHSNQRTHLILPVFEITDRNTDFHRDFLFFHHAVYGIEQLKSLQTKTPKSAIEKFLNGKTMEIIHSINHRAVVENWYLTVRVVPA